MTLKIMNSVIHAPRRWEPKKRERRPRSAGALRSRITTKVEDPEERHHRDEVLQEAEHRPVADQRDRPGERVGAEGERDQGAVRLEVDRGQDQEGPEHEEVRGARHAPLQQLLLPEDLDDLSLHREAEPPRDACDAVGGGLSAGDQALEEPHPAPRDRQRDQVEEQPDDQYGGHSHSERSGCHGRSAPTLRARQAPAALDLRIVPTGNFVRSGPCRTSQAVPPSRLVSAAAARRTSSARVWGASSAKVTARPATGCWLWSRTGAATLARPGVTSPSSVA